MRQPEERSRDIRFMLDAARMLISTARGGGRAQSANDQVGAAPGPWAAGVDRVDEALARGDVDGARTAWRDAYLAAVEDPRWQGMAALGDAALSIGRAAGAPQACKVQARQSYVAALLRACQQRSLDGVLRAAGAFAELGDRETAERCRRIADELARRAAAPVAAAAPHAVLRRA